MIRTLYICWPVLSEHLIKFVEDVLNNMDLFGVDALYEQN